MGSLNNRQVPVVDAVPNEIHIRKLTVRRAELQWAATGIRPGDHERRCACPTCPRGVALTRPPQTGTLVPAGYSSFQYHPDLPLATIGTTSRVTTRVRQQLWPPAGFNGRLNFTGAQGARAGEFWRGSKGERLRLLDGLRPGRLTGELPPGAVRNRPGRTTAARHSRRCWPHVTRTLIPDAWRHGNSGQPHQWHLRRRARVDGAAATATS